MSPFDWNITALTDFLDEDIPEPKHIIEDLLKPEGRMVIYGPEGSHKSLLSIHLAHCIASGEDWLGYNCTASSVLLIQTENSKANFQERLNQYYTLQEPTGRIHLSTTPPFNLDYWDGVGGAKSLQAEVHFFKPEVIIIDPFYQSISKDAGDTSAVLTWQKNIDRVLKSSGSSLIVIAHGRKYPPDLDTPPLGTNELYGSSHQKNWYDSMIQVVKLEESSTSYQRRLHFAKHRDARRKPRDIIIRYTDTLIPDVVAEMPV